MVSSPSYDALLLVLYTVVDAVATRRHAPQWPH